MVYNLLTFWLYFSVTISLQNNLITKLIFLFISDISGHILTPNPFLHMQDWIKCPILWIRNNKFNFKRLIHMWQNQFSLSMSSKYWCECVLCVCVSYNIRIIKRINTSEFTSSCKVTGVPIKSVCTNSIDLCTDYVSDQLSNRKFDSPCPR